MNNIHYLVFWYCIVCVLLQKCDVLYDVSNKYDIIPYSLPVTGPLHASLAPLPTTRHPCKSAAGEKFPLNLLYIHVKIVGKKSNFLEIDFMIKTNDKNPRSK